LKAIDRWIVWRAGPVKENGKFDKVSCSPATGRNINGQAPRNWLTYEDALAAYDKGKSDGIGNVLNVQWDAGREWPAILVGQHSPMTSFETGCGVTAAGNPLD
jgi:hypothetical protein